MDMTDGYPFIFLMNDKSVRSFVSDVLSSRVFKHHRNNELSLYILVNKEAVADEQKYVDRITNEVKSAMQ